MCAYLYLGVPDAYWWKVQSLGVYVKLNAFLKENVEIMDAYPFSLW